MPIDLTVAETVIPSVTADRFLICGFQVRESDYNTGVALPSPTITIYWVKLDKTTGAVKDRGAHTFAPTAFATEKPDGTKSYRANLKARLYKQLVDDGVFPAGVVS